MNNFYDVIAVDDANPKNRETFFARGLSLDRAQALALQLNNDGIATNTQTGLQGDSIDNRSVTATVVRSNRTGETVNEEVIESLTIAASGYEAMVTLANSFIQGSVSVEIEGETAKVTEINPKAGTIVLRYEDSSLISITDEASATYDTPSTNDVLSIINENHDSDVDGTETVFELTHVYIPNTLSITTSATGEITIIEGGGKYVEILINSLPIINGKTLKISYDYSLNDDTAIPAAEVFPWVPPVWVGTVRNPPFDS